MLAGLKTWTISKELPPAKYLFSDKWLKCKPSIKYLPRNWFNSSRLEVLKKSVKLLIFLYIYPNLLPFIKNHFAATSKLSNFSIHQVQLPFFDKYLVVGPRTLMNVEIFKESLTGLLLLILVDVNAAFVEEKWHPVERPVPRKNTRKSVEETPRSSTEKDAALLNPLDPQLLYRERNPTTIHP